MFDLGRSFIATVERSPSALAVVDGDRRLSYAQWYAEVCRVIDGLTALGLRKGDHLAVVLQNRLAMASLHWASQLAGFVIVPRNWRAKAEELDFCITDTEAHAIVYEQVSSAAVAGSAAAHVLPRVAVGGAAGATDHFETFADVGREHTPQAGPEDFSLIFTPREPPGCRKACRAATAPSAPQHSPMSLRTLTPSASALSARCRSTTRWGCVRCWRWC